MIAKVCAQASLALNEAAVIQHMHNVEELWQELFPAEQQRITQLLVEGVYLKIDGVEVRVRAEGLASLSGEMENDEQMETLERKQVFDEVA